MFQSEINKNRLRQYAYGLDNLEWSHVLLELVTFFKRTNVFVFCFLLRDLNCKSSGIILIAGKFSPDEET